MIFSPFVLLSCFGIVENYFYFVAAGGGGAIFNPATRRRSEGNDASERISASRALMEFVIASSGMVLVIYELNPIAQFVLPKPFVPSLRSLSDTLLRPFGRNARNLI